MASVAFQLTALYETVEDGWIQGRIHELPGVITVGSTRREAQEMLLDALREYWLSLPVAGERPSTGDGAPDLEPDDVERVEVTIAS